VRNEMRAAIEQRRTISRMAHVVERVGLAIAGVVCGLFVAAGVIRAHAATFDTVGFVMMMCLIGMAGFYLGIDIPRRRIRAVPHGNADWLMGVNPIEWLSASGTLLAAMAALISVTMIILDETAQLTLTMIVGGGWLFGATLQVAAGALARLRAAPQSAG
jgi:hypothetical protein